MENLRIVTSNKDTIIDHGWQYTVYDLKNGRVLKMKKSLIQAYLTFAKQRKYKSRSATMETVFEKIMKQPSLFISLFQNIHVRFPHSINGLRSKIEDGVDASMFGNPIFFPSMHYEQDKVQIVGSFINEIDEQRQKEIVSMFVERTLELWRYGICDISFAVVRNYGIHDGVLRAIDLGDFTFNQTVAEQVLTSNIPLEAWDYLNATPAPFKKEYRNAFEKYLTTSSLRRNWNMSEAIKSKTA